MSARIAIVGSGFAGAVLARELADSEKFDITIFEERKHLAGNCFTERDPQTAIMLHRYGPHIFNTSNKEVWDYVQRWSRFHPFINRVKAVTERGVFSLPINLLTLNQFFDARMSPSEAKAFVASLADTSIESPENFEEQALKFLGSDLYENFFYGYTKKQWGVEPSLLPASILKRLPIRFNYDDNYYNQKFQGIPEDGYTTIIEKILKHPKIEVHLNEAFLPGSEMSAQFKHLFWSGPLDAYFSYRLGRLAYRSLEFERIDAVGDYQGNAVINYCQEQIPFTRIAEHKHFAYWEEHTNSVCFREYSRSTQPGEIPYYPLRLARDKGLLADYHELAFELSKSAIPQVTFLGRLGTYRYLDMHQVIAESLDLAKSCLSLPMHRWPVFSTKI